MANLETLELTINGNAEKASQGIDTLITSLSSLSRRVGKAVSGLMKLNEELRTLKSFGAIKLPNIGKMTGATSVASRAKTPTVEEIRAWQQAGEAKRTYANNMGWTKGFETEEERRAKNPQWYQDPNEQAREAQRNLKENGDASWAKESKKALEGYNNILGETKKATQEVTTATKEASTSVSEIKEQSEETTSTFSKLKEGFKDFASGVSRLFSRIKRIATTMLIRAAIRGLIRSMKEGVNNVYEWSKTVNGSFAKSMNEAKAATLTLKNSLGAMLSPVIQALIPLFRSLTSAIINAANWLNQFVALLSGQKSWTKAVEQGAEAMEGASDAAGSGAKATKEWLAAFDELNVMQNESGSGGGGSVTSGTDYGGMFEEITAFDEKIRQISEYVKENLGVIEGLAIAAGTALLAWKFGNAFLETLPVLSNIFGFVATGATIALTVGLTWLFANEYMQTGDDGWLWAEVLSTAVGTVAAASIAQKLFKGQAGAYAASITLAFTAITGIVANVQNTDVSAFDSKSIKQNIISALEMGGAAGIILQATGLVTGGWAILAAGGVALLTFGVATAIKLLTAKNDIEVDSNLYHLSKEQIDAYVKSKMFTIDPQIFIDCTNTVVDEQTVNTQAIQDQIKGYIGTLNVINLGLADENDYATIKKQILGDAGDGSGGLIGSINTWLNSQSTLDKMVLKLMPKVVGETPAEQQEWYNLNKAGWDTIKEFINGKGKELADEIVEGEKGELIVKRPDRVATLLNEINTIAEILAGTNAKTELKIDFDLKLQNMDSSSFNEAMNTYNTYKEQAAIKGQELVDTLIANKERMVDALGEMLKLDPDNEKLKEQLAEAEADLADLRDNYKEKLNAAIDEMAAPGRDLLAEWIANNFQKNTVSVTWTTEYLRDILNADGFEEGIKAIFTDQNFDMTNVNITDFLSVGGWDLLTKDMQTKIISSMSLTPETIRTLKDACGVSASDLFAVQDWDSFTSDQRKDFINSIREIYGDEAAIKAAKEAGIDISDVVGDALKENKPAIMLTADEAAAAKAAKDASSTAAKNITNPTIGVTANTNSAKTAATTITNTTKSNLGTPAIGVTADTTSATKAAKSMQTSANNYVKKNPIKTKIAADKTSLTNFENIIKKDRVTNVKANLTNATEIGKKVGDGVGTGIKNKLSKVKVTVNANGTVNVAVTAARGAYGLKNGQLFIANEAGAEMVGSMDGKTAVANQQQIVEGIRKGVADGQAEQNALLRQQNSILMGILQKSSNVTIGASSALGRVVNQSLQMYGAVTGV